MRRGHAGCVLGLMRCFHVSTLVGGGFVNSVSGRGVLPWILHICPDGLVQKNKVTLQAMETSPVDAETVTALRDAVRDNGERGLIVASKW